MAKRRSTFECSECGHEEPKWLGRCPSCGRWNTFIEIALPEGAAGAGSSSGRRAGGGAGRGAGGKARSSGGTGADGGSGRQAVNPTPLSRIDASEGGRISAGIGEMDRVLGGGMTIGSSVLIGGEPGIGKSTLMLQLASSVRGDGPVAYVSGEESASQIKMRAERLGLVSGAGGGQTPSRGGQSAEPHLICETDLERIIGLLRKMKAKVAVVDSIQTLLSVEAGNVPGTVNQLKYGCYELIDWAREENAALFLVAHVTKEGSIAGPKVIEHMVDTVLYFDQASSGLRILRAVKNRFGSVDEIGIFTMEPEGLIQVADPASYFLEQRVEVPPGIAAAPVYEGSRVLMVEIQALVIPAKSGYTRIYSDKIDTNRVSRVAAVLEKHLSLRFSDRDIYINVAGGMKLDEVGIELPLAVALYSARIELAVPKNTAVAGEISLAGEIRPTAHMQRRARTAAEMGFTRFLGAAPAGSSSAASSSVSSVKSSSSGGVSSENASGGVAVAKCSYGIVATVKKSIQEVFGELRGAK